MNDELHKGLLPQNQDEKVLDPSNLDAERHAYLKEFEKSLETDNQSALKRLALELSPGDLSETLRPLSVEDTAKILCVLPPDPLAEVLAEIDKRSMSALFTLLDIDESRTSSKKCLLMRQLM